jgi:hypothetical protein
LGKRGRNWLATWHQAVLAACGVSSAKTVHRSLWIVATLFQRSHHFRTE